MVFRYFWWGSVIERSCDSRNSAYVDDEFLRFLKDRVDESAMKSLKQRNHYKINNLINKYFCPKIKIPFTDEKSKFKVTEFNINKVCPQVKKYVTGLKRQQLS